jgi:hypothetical protein
LPSRLDLAADGKWTAIGVLPKFDTLWKLAEGIAAGRWGGDEQARQKYTGDQAVDAAVLCLQANYRLGRIETAMLGILTDELASDVLDRLVDGPVFAEFLKKKVEREASRLSAAGSSSSVGREGSTPPMPPPSPT